MRDLVRAGIEGSITLVREHHPRFGDLTAGSSAATGFKLADAQLTVARHYGFASWAKLRHYVETVNRLTRSPHAHSVGGPIGDDALRADELLRLACLNYGNDHPARWADADRLLAEHPHLAAHSILTAAAVGALDAVQAHLARDPDAAEREGGPFGWPPLLYLTYSRLGPGAGRDPVGVAKLLLETGADPNAGYLFDGLPSPFTALTGVFGGGEQGAPPHRDELVLARLLLAAGAEANDSQTIYNRGAGDIARDDTDFLELLLDHGSDAGTAVHGGGSSITATRLRPRSLLKRSNMRPRPVLNGGSACCCRAASTRTSLAPIPATTAAAHTKARSCTATPRSPNSW